MFDINFPAVVFCDNKSLLTFFSYHSQHIDLADEYCSPVNDFFKLFDSPPVGADNNIDVVNLEKVEKQKCEVEHCDKSLKMNVEVENRRKLIEKLNSPPMKKALDQCVNKKRRFEDVIRSPYVENQNKTSQVPSPEQLRGRMNIEDPVIAERLLEVRPWVEV